MALFLSICAFAVVVWTWIYFRERKRSTGGFRPDQPSDFPRLSAEMKARAEPTLLLLPTETPGFSRIGGAPELDDPTLWPASEGRPCTFLAQFDLKAVRAAGGPEWMPEKGVLFFFVGADETAQLDEPDNPLRAVWRPKAGSKPILDGPAPYAPHSLSFTPRRSYPDVEMLDDIRKINVTDEELDQLSSLDQSDYADQPTNAYGDIVASRMGGFPDCIQSEHWQIECEVAARGLDQKAAYRQPLDPELVAASKAWRMAAQFKTDERLGVAWPGSGAVYLYVREADARAGDFSKTQSIWQAY